MADEYGTRRDGRVYPKDSRRPLSDIVADLRRTAGPEYSDDTLERVALLKQAYLAGEISFNAYFDQSKDILRAERRDPYYEKRHPTLARLKHEGRRTAVKHKVVYRDGRYEVT